MSSTIKGAIAAAIAGALAFATGSAAGGLTPAPAWKSAGGGDCETAVAVCLAESGGKPNAQYVNSDQYHSVDRGLGKSTTTGILKSAIRVRMMQIVMPDQRRPFPAEEVTDSLAYLHVWRVSCPSLCSQCSLWWCWGRCWLQRLCSCVSTGGGQGYLEKCGNCGSSCTDCVGLEAAELAQASAAVSLM